MTRSPRLSRASARWLPATLTEAGIDTLLIAGVFTSGRVRATVLDACQHGSIPMVVGDRPGGSHDANLFDLQAEYAEVRSLRQVQRYLAGS